MNEVESVPLLSRITGVLFPPDSTRPLRGLACLVHPRVAVTPRDTLSVFAGDRLHLNVRLDERIWETGVTVASRNNRLVVLLLDEAPEFELPGSFLAGRSEVPAGPVEIVVAPREPPYLLRPVRVEAEGFAARSTEGLVIRHPEVPVGYEWIAGTPLVADEKLFGIVDQRTEDVLLAIHASVLPLDPAVAAAVRRATDGERVSKGGAGSGGMSIGPRPVSDDAQLFATLSGEAMRVLASADAMRTRQGMDRVHMEHLIAGIADAGDDTSRRLLTLTGLDPTALRRLLADVAKSPPIPLPGQLVLGAQTTLPPRSAHVGDALAAALAAARRVGADAVETRHLLAGAAAITECTLIEALRERGLTPEWVLEEAPEEVMAAPKEPVPALRVVGEPVGGVRYDADRAEGDDALGIGREVRALASVLAAEDTPLPLSLGLFGDWGSGKSFFMHELEKEIKSRAEEARKDEHSAYCAGIVQLKFNAWHYIDTNLWASLAAAIFEGIARKLDDPEGKGSSGKLEALRAEYLSRTEHLRQVRDEKVERKHALDGELRAEEERLARLRAEQGRVERSLAPAELLKAAYRHVLGEPEVARKFNAAAEEIGVRDDVVDLRARLVEMGRLRRRAWAAAKALRNRPVATLVLVAGVLLALALAALVPWAAETWRLTALVPLLTTLVGVWAKLRPGVEKLVGIVESAQGSAEERVRDEEKALVEKRDRLKTAADLAQEQVNRTGEELAEVQRQLDGLHPDRQFGDFVRERWQSSDYTRHLGVIARARTDFEALTARLKQVLAAEAPARLPDGTELPRVERIVLYIDDLDRCPEDKVVDVLQAVHLLLAFELFVVVVGVDSRWLLHSLRSHSTAFRARRDGADDGDELSNEERVHWQSTPLNYLEKIFQIPFTLRPMGQAGFHDLIDSLANPKQKEKEKPDAGRKTKGGASSLVSDAVADRTDTTSADASPPAASTGDGTTSAEGTDSGAAALAVSQQAVSNVGVAQSNVGDSAAQADAERKRAEKAAEAAALAARLQIRDWERDFMKRLHRLIPTPRAAKRFMNVYRLIRGSLDAERYEALVGSDDAGEHRAALLLLALLTGYPAEATVILRDLVEERPAGDWWDYLDALERRRRDADAAREPQPAAQREVPAEAGAEEEAQAQAQAPEAPRAEVPHPFDGLEGIEPARWEEMLERLESVRPHLPDAECGDFVTWAPEVGRYSFYSGRVLLGRTAADADAAAQAQPTAAA